MKGWDWSEAYWRADHIKKVITRIFFYFVWDQLAEEEADSSSSSRERDRWTATRQLPHSDGLVRSELQGLERVKACKYMV